MKRHLIAALAVLVIVFSLCAVAVVQSGILPFGQTLLYCFEEKFDQGVESSETYLSKYPNNHFVWRLRGDMLEELDRDAEAETSYQKALELYSLDADAHLGLGILKRKTGDLDSALAQYEKAVTLDPNHAHAFSSMTVIFLKQNKDEEALRVAKKAYDYISNDPTITANLAVAYHYNQDPQNRDHYTEQAKLLGYRNIETLKQIYAGELTVRD